MKLWNKLWKCQGFPSRPLTTSSCLIVELFLNNYLRMYKYILSNIIKSFNAWLAAISSIKLLALVIHYNNNNMQIACIKVTCFNCTETWLSNHMTTMYTHTHTGITHNTHTETRISLSLLGVLVFINLEGVATMWNILNWEHTLTFKFVFNFVKQELLCR